MDRVDSLAECPGGAEEPADYGPNKPAGELLCGRTCWTMTSKGWFFAARHQSRLNTGRFRSPKKKQEFTPGWRSQERGGLAQCHDGISILEDYRKIRRRILSNGTLVDVSHTTLQLWHNKRVNREDHAVVLQGLVLPSRLSVASDPLPPANVRPQSSAPQPAAAIPLLHPSGPQMVLQALPCSTLWPSDGAAAIPCSPSGPQMVRQRQLFPAPALGHCSWIFNPVTSQVQVQVAAPQAPK
ncbi:hypothetical protein KUCAC02_037881, partial [Chaenocephalus aceratus]